MTRAAQILDSLQRSLSPRDRLRSCPVRPSPSVRSPVHTRLARGRRCGRQSSRGCSLSPELDWEEWQSDKRLGASAGETLLLLDQSPSWISSTETRRLETW